jgi:hypothetical protein
MAHHLTHKEREIVAPMHHDWRKQCETADTLGRDPSSISREFATQRRFARLHRTSATGRTASSAVYVNAVLNRTGTCENTDETTTHEAKDTYRSSRGI